MSTLIHRDYAGDGDLDTAVDLWIAARAAGGIDPWPPLDTIHAELAARPRGTAYAQLWEDHRAGPIGMAMLLDESVLVWCARAGAGDEALASEIIAWGLAGASSAARRVGERPILFVPVLSDDWQLAALLERAGFQEDEWRTLRMGRSLHAPIEAPLAPADVVIRPVADAHDIVSTTALHSALFAGGRKSVSERATLMRSSGYRPALDLLAVRPDGSAAGYVLGMCGALERQRLAQLTGWLEFVGVDRAQRGRGIGRALTLHLLHALRAEGLDTVLLTTGATNTAARHLFEGCGFRTRYEIRWYVFEADHD